MLQVADSAFGLENPLTVEKLATISRGSFDESAAEIVQFDPVSERLFVTNADSGLVDILRYDALAEALVLEGTLSAAVMAGLDGFNPGGPTSVSISAGVVAVAVSDATETSPGRVGFYDTTTGAYINSVRVGALPDMLTFSPDGRYVLTADEGQPGGAIDPEGSVSIVDVSGGVAALTNADVATAGFTGFNTQAAALEADGVILSDAGTLPAPTVAQNLEPEYIAVSPDSSSAYVALQEANAFAIVDVATATVTSITGLGFKDHSIPGQGLDVSDFDGINIDTYPVLGLYQPDSIAAYAVDGGTYVVSANEGDNRSFEITKARPSGSFVLLIDPALEAQLLAAGIDCSTLTLGCVTLNLSIHEQVSDTDGDGDADRLVAFGARSLSIWDSSGGLVYDSGDAIEQAIADPANGLTGLFNADNTSANADTRSVQRGPEPEGVTIGTLQGRTFAFLGLERSSQIVIFDITSPANAKLVQIINNRAGITGDLGPEGLAFIPAADSPTGEAWLAVANEVSGTTTLYALSAQAAAAEVPMPGSAPLLLLIGTIATISHAAYRQRHQPHKRTQEGISI